MNTINCLGLTDLAKGKKAWLSSESKLSHPNDAWRAMDDDDKRDFAFHTRKEDNPWWLIDLEKTSRLFFLVIGNRRRTRQEKAATLTVEISDDLQIWETVHTGLIFWHGDLTLPLMGELTARYVKLSLRAKNIHFHLAKVEIWGTLDPKFETPFPEDVHTVISAEENTDKILPFQTLDADAQSPVSERRIDLGKLHTIEAIKIGKPESLSWKEGSRLKIEVSQNDVDWQLIHEGHLCWEGVLSWPLQGRVIGRYIRLSLYDQGNGKLNLFNIEVYGNLLRAIGKGVVYTCITGAYDRLREVKFPVDNTDYICFTDSPSLRSKTWNIKLIESFGDNTRLSAKKPKILPHEYLSSYAWSLWIDSNIEIKDNLLCFILEELKNCKIKIFSHRQRNCIYQEAHACSMLKKDEPDRIYRQVLDYKKKGFPEKFGLWEAGLILRKHNEKDVVQFCKTWWNEIIRYSSKRDQLSLPYVHWMIPGILKSFSTIPTIKEASFFTIKPHSNTTPITQAFVGFCSEDLLFEDYGPVCETSPGDQYMQFFKCDTVQYLSAISLRIALNKNKMAPVCECQFVLTGYKASIEKDVSKHELYAASVSDFSDFRRRYYTILTDDVPVEGYSFFSFSIFVKNDVEQGDGVTLFAYSDPSKTVCSGNERSRLSLDSNHDSRENKTIPHSNCLYLNEKLTDKVLDFCVIGK